MSKPSPVLPTMTYADYKRTPDLHHSLTDLLKFADVPWSPGAIIELLIRAGLIERVPYESSTRPGVMKHCERWREGVDRFGANVLTGHRPTDVDLRFRDSTFVEVLALAARQLAVELARAEATESEWRARLQG